MRPENDEHIKQRVALAKFGSIWECQSCYSFYYISHFWLTAWYVWCRLCCIDQTNRESCYVYTASLNHANNIALYGEIDQIFDWRLEGKNTMRESEGYEHTVWERFNSNAVFDESVEKMVQFHWISKHTFYKRKKERVEFRTMFSTSWSEIQHFLKDCKIWKKQ